MMVDIVKFLHLICGTTFLGTIIAVFFYIAYSVRQTDPLLIYYSLRISYFGDGVISFCAFIQFITAAILVPAGKFTLAVPWICVAYVAFGSVILLWLMNLLIKLIYFSKIPIKPYALKGFYFLNSLIIIIFIIIIHDAITQSTWFDFLFASARY